MCGTAPWEWEEDRRAYTPSEVFCPGCHLKAVAGEDAEALKGTTVTLISTRGQQAAKRLVEQKRAFERLSQDADDEPVTLSSR